MLTGFQLDSNSKSVPFGTRIVVTLSSPGEDSFTFAISSGELIQNYISKPSSPKPQLSDEIWLEPTPDSDTQRFVIHTPEGQRIIVGDFPDPVSFEITVERKFANKWMTTNKVLVVVEKNKNQIFQAREFAPKSEALEVESEKKIINESLPKPEADEVIESDNLINEELVQINYELIEPNDDPIPPQRKSFRRTRNFALIILIFLGIFILTPLSLVHPEIPEDEKSKIVIVLPVKEPIVGQTIAASLNDSDGKISDYLGVVENKSKDTYLLRNGENFIQVNVTQIQGRVVISIPLVGTIFSKVFGFFQSG